MSSDIFLNEFVKSQNDKLDELLAIEPLNSLSVNSEQRTQLFRLFSCSEFASAVCQKNPEYTLQLLVSSIAKQEKLLPDYLHELQTCTASVTEFDLLGEVFRKYRNCEMLRIVWRDAVLYTPVSETLRELSALADACINVGMAYLFDEAMQKWGEPLDTAGKRISPVIFAMGKLGAYELNFSSDIDLIFTYSEDGEVSKGSRSLSHSEFFTRVCQNFIRLLSDNTAYGFVFRVDARLRPFGSAGSLVLSFDAMESYYEQHGREWERYAFIKARAISADVGAAKEISDRLRPFVYRRYLDYSAFASLREMKQLIDKEVVRKGNQNNVKLGPGGIREIEFIGQAYQLIRGGRDKHLQTRGILDVLAILKSQKLLPDYVYVALCNAYVFLRKTENAIQYYADQQTHMLPSGGLEQQRLAYAMNYSSWDSFYHDVRRHMQTVHEHFDQIFSAPQLQSFDKETEKNVFANLWRKIYSEAEAIEILKDEGYPDPTAALNFIMQFRDGPVRHTMGENGRQRLDHLMPLLLSAVTQVDDPMACLSRIIRLIEAIARRTAYIALLAENPLGLSQLVKLFGKSQWLADLLASYPMLLDELLDPRRLYEPMSKQQLAEEIRYKIDLNDTDVETQMRTLIEFKQTNVLRVAASELSGAMPVYKVSDHLTYIAEIVLENVTQLVSSHLRARHGTPCYRLNGEPHEAGFCIIAYGKLGGLELGFGSDLDLVFLHDSQGEQQETSGEKNVDNAVYFARLAQRIIHFLNTSTQSGVLYEVDTRLRPSGGSGLLVSSMTSFTEYQQHQAWTWEHQALIRARPIVGSESLIAQFNQIRKAILQLKRDPQKLLQDVVDMRRRMRKELHTANENEFDLKQGFGGIADIEFLSQYLVLRWAGEYESLTVYTDNLRILENLAKEKLLDEDDAKMLTQAYLGYRHRVHELVLQNKKAIIGKDDGFAHYQHEVSRIWRGIMGDF